MTVSIAPLLVPQFFDDNGNELVGGQLFTYAAGTSATKLATYTDSTGSTPNKNPIILDDRGECSIWLPNGVGYKFVLAPATDTDPPTNPFWTVDQIMATGGVASIGGESGNITLGQGLSIANQVLSATIYPNYLSKLTLSTAGSSAIFGIADGLAVDSTNAALMSLPSAFTKTTSPWAAGTGNGALDVGAGIINNSWYHTFLIQRSDTGAVDVIVSQAPGISGVATITIATPGVITLANHGLQIGAPVKFSTTGALPTGIVAGTIYYVQSVPTVNTFTIAATQGGSAIATTGTQSGVQTLIANPILPANYNLFRRIGSMRTDGSGLWRPFFQNGDQFNWNVVVADVTSQTIGTSAVAYALTVPPGVVTSALVSVRYGGASGQSYLYIYPTILAVPATTNGIGSSISYNTSSLLANTADLNVLANTSGQITAISDQAGGSIWITTLGWIDPRGKNG